MIGIIAACLLLVSLLLLRDTQQSTILVVSFAFRVFLSVIHVAGFALPDSQFDARTFEQVAWLWARDGRFLDDFTTSSYLYSWLSSGVYLLFGRVPLLLHVINSYFGTLAIYFVMRSAQLLLPDTHADRTIGWTLCFYPSVALYSVLTMREAPMVLALSISIYLLITFVSTRRIIFGLGAVFFSIVAQLFHAGTVGATLAVLLIYSRVSLQSVTVRDNLRPIALLVVLATAVGMLQFSLRTGVGLEKVSGFLREFNVDTIAEWQDYSARGRGAYLSGVAIDAWIDLIWNVPLRVLFLFGSPFIWMVSRFRDVLGLLDAFIYLYLVFRVTLDAKRQSLWTSHAYLSVALVIAAIVVLFALGTSNYGTAFRHRAKVFPWLLMLYVYGINQSRRSEPTAYDEEQKRTEKVANT